jgi:hypothetical protein
MKRPLIVLGAAVLAALVAIGVLSLLPSSYPSYRETAVSAAQESLSAARTLIVATQAAQQGRLLSPVLTTVVEDARGAASTAEQQISAEDVPDERSATLRDELTPLLADTVRYVGDVARAVDAGDDVLLRTALDQLAATADDLADFTKRYEQ